MNKVCINHNACPTWNSQCSVQVERRVQVATSQSGHEKPLTGDTTSLTDGARAHECPDTLQPD
jgi:hypothetical protein